jgi:heptosyltransferase-2
VKILVRVPNWVGDCVMCLPALQAIRARAPRAEIALLGRPWVAELFSDQSLADRILVFDHTGRHRGLGGVERLARELKSERFACAILLQNAFQAAWISWRAGIPERIGYARDARGCLLTKAIPVPHPGEIPAHETFYYVELLRRAGWLDTLDEIARVTLNISASARERAEAKLAVAGAPRDMGRLRVAVAPGAAYGAARCWLPERYAAVADRLAAECAADVILFGSPEEREVVAQVAAAMREKCVNLAGETSIGELPALLACCDLFLGNDSGAMHVAAAVGLPVVAVIGPTDPQGTAPMTPLRTLVQRKVECSPCFLRRCPIDHRCMTQISATQVFDAVRNRIAGAN